MKQTIHVQNPTRQQITKQIVEDMLTKLQASIENGIDSDNKHIPIEYLDEWNR